MLLFFWAGEKVYWHFISSVSSVDWLMTSEYSGCHLEALCCHLQKFKTSYCIWKHCWSLCALRRFNESSASCILHKKSKIFWLCSNFITFQACLTLPFTPCSHNKASFEFVWNSNTKHAWRNNLVHAKISQDHLERSLQQLFLSDSSNLEQSRNCLNQFY